MTPQAIIAAFERLIAELRRGGKPRLLGLAIAMGLAALGASRTLPFPATIANGLTFGLLFVVTLLAVWLFFVVSRQALPYLTDDSVDTPSTIKGSEAFGLHDSQVFQRLERAEEIRQLLSRALDDQLPLTVVMGPSGVGKTSLLRAGLQAALLAHAPPITVEYYEALPNSAGTLAETISAALADATSGAPRVIILDQLEQLAPDQPEHRRVFDILRAASANHQHYCRFVVAFRDEYASTWFPWEQDARPEGRLAPIVNLKPLSLRQASDVLVLLATEAGLSLTTTLVTELMTSVSTASGVLPVDIGITLQMIFELSRARGTPNLDEKDFRISGGSDALLAAYVQNQLDDFHLRSEDREALLRALLLLIDLAKNQRISDGKDLVTLSVASLLPQRTATITLNRLASRQVRILETLDGNRFRLRHDRFVPAIRRVAGASLAAQERASLLFDSLYSIWTQHRRPQFLLSGSDLRLISSHAATVLTPSRSADEYGFYRLSIRKRSNRRVASITLPVLALVVGLVFQIYSRADAHLAQTIFERVRDQGLLVYDEPNSKHEWFISAAPGLGRHRAMLLARTMSYQAKTALSGSAAAFAFVGESLTARALIDTASLYSDFPDDSWAEYYADSLAVLEKCAPPHLADDFAVVLRQRFRDTRSQSTFVASLAAVHMTRFVQVVVDLDSVDISTATGASLLNTGADVSSALLRRWINNAISDGNVSGVIGIASALHSLKRTVDAEVAVKAVIEWPPTRPNGFSWEEDDDVRAVELFDAGFAEGAAALLRRRSSDARPLSGFYGGYCAMFLHLDADPPAPSAMESSRVAWRVGEAVCLAQAGRIQDALRLSGKIVESGPDHLVTMLAIVCMASADDKVAASALTQVLRQLKSQPDHRVEQIAWIVAEELIRRDRLYEALETCHRHVKQPRSRLELYRLILDRIGHRTYLRAALLTPPIAGAEWGGPLELAVTLGVRTKGE